MPVKICSIEKGQVFVPFHYGYFDALDDRAKAANELTQGMYTRFYNFWDLLPKLIRSLAQWDPISKQPMFKSGSVRIVKAKDAEGNVKIHAREQHTGTIRTVEESKANAEKPRQEENRKRYLESWLASTYGAVITLLDLYEERLIHLTSDMEAQSGFKKMSMLTRRIEETLEPYLHEFKVSKPTPPNISISLSDALFSSTQDEGPAAYQTLVLLQKIEVYLYHLSGQLTVLLTATAAMWDDKFEAAVRFSHAQVQRQLSWVQNMVKVQSPQTLIVPARVT